MKVGFLFNHDAGHQAFHLLPIINAYAAMRPDDDIRAYVGGEAMLEAVNAGLAPGRGRVELVGLPLPPLFGALMGCLDTVAPASRLARLRLNVDRFRDLDALVAPERTCLLLKDLVGPSFKFIHCRHGAGDREKGFHPELREFDLLLLPGPKFVRRLEKVGALQANEYAFIGYPKFDAVALKSPPKKFFANSNPTVIYNPHFSPELSSWYPMGEAVLDWFAANPDLNLIFAPHVMLFERRWHIELAAMKAALRKRLPERFRHKPNILIDVNSTRLFDMSYTLSADLYLGDVSSQVMEFIARPRPCVFLNPNRLAWAGDEAFAAWKVGRVVENVTEMGKSIRWSLQNRGAFALQQKAHFADTFDLTDEPSASRAARAIVDFVEQGRSFRLRNVAQ
ncbi:MAG: hypothetical protein U5J99_00415 [Parvularculaceae bacterium]|nr:hypothetical protein [Parvularculaceae bacterium]